MSGSTICCNIPHNKGYIPSLEQFLKQQFATSAFNHGPSFLEMKTTHLKPDAIPLTPIPVPHHWKGQVRKRLDADIEKVIITKAPVRTPITWCSQLNSSKKRW